jgi:hypothetical protein
MPRYYFALDDDLPLSGAAEELANDTIASNVATLIAGELSRNRYGRDQVAVSVFDERGQVIHKIWTRSEYDVGRGQAVAQTPDSPAESNWLLGQASVWQRSWLQIRRVRRPARKASISSAKTRPTLQVGRYRSCATRTRGPGQSSRRDCCNPWSGRAGLGNKVSGTDPEDVRPCWREFMGMDGRQPYRDGQTHALRQFND